MTSARQARVERTASVAPAGKAAGAGVSSRRHERSQPAHHTSYLEASIQRRARTAPRRALDHEVLQARFRLTRPSDPLELEAERVADTVMRCSGPAASPSGSCGCDSCGHEPQDDDVVHRRASGAAAPAWSGELGLDGSPARPLDDGARRWFEPRFGRDLGQVRVHADPVAAASAARVDALAYTVGHHIVFGAGQYVPGTPAGRHLIAHELAHVLQQASAAGPVVARLDASMCASGGACHTPEGTGPATGRYEVAVFADKEGSFLGIPFTHKVGHSWVRLTAADGRYWTYGFWPQVGYDASNTKADVAGCVHAPDGPGGRPAHSPTSSRTFEVTAAQFAKARTLAVTICTTAPKYNLFGLQCTEFARRILEAAGQASALGFGLIWESPNALESWLESNSLTLGSGVASVTGGGGAEWAGLDLTYRHQFYSLLGAKLRLQGLARLEAGPRMAGLTAAPAVEVTTNRVFLPSLYVFGGGFAGGLAPPGRDWRPSAGVTGGVGLLQRIDELATVGVEYNVVKDLVRDDRELHRLMVTAGIRFW